MIEGKVNGFLFHWFVVERSKDFSCALQYERLHPKAHRLNDHSIYFVHRNSSQSGKVKRLFPSFHASFILCHVASSVLEETLLSNATCSISSWTAANAFESFHLSMSNHKFIVQGHRERRMFRLELNEVGSAMFAKVQNVESAMLTSRGFEKCKQRISFLDYQNLLAGMAKSWKLVS